MRGEYAYYQSLSGLDNKRSLGDHQSAYWAAQTGLPGTTNQDDLERAFLKQKTGLSTGTMQDLNLAYWKSVAPVGLASNLSVDDYKLATIIAAGF